MKAKEVKEALLKGTSFSNEKAGWYTLVNTDKKVYWIVIKGRNLFCKNLDSCSRRITQLINKGY